VLNIFKENHAINLPNLTVGTECRASQKSGAAEWSIAENDKVGGREMEPGAGVTEIGLSTAFTLLICSVS